MRDTGIVRRIDELGRIVIPKEIRRTLRIKEGDPLEIFTDKSQLIFEKYSPVERLFDYSCAICEALAEMTEKECMVTDRDQIVYSARNKNKDLIGKRISSDLENILNDRKSIVNAKSDGGNIIKLCNEDNLNAENQIIVPILTNGEYLGGLILFDRDKNSKLSPIDVKLCLYSANVFSKHFS